MLPNKSFNPKFFILENGDIIKKGDQWYDPINDTWNPVSNGRKNEDGFYPDAVIGYEYIPDEHKPMRRINKNHIKNKRVK